MRSFLLSIIALFIIGTIQTQAQTDELVNTCALDIGNATYLKDFKVKLQQSNVKPAPSAKFSVVLNKGTVYKINVCNAQGYEGKAVVKLMENNTLLGTNQKTDGSFLDALGFACQKTGVYQIQISFDDGKEGAAVAILSFINKS